jgi:hypothetical protein
VAELVEQWRSSSLGGKRTSLVIFTLLLQELVLMLLCAEEDVAVDRFRLNRGRVV